MINPRDREHAHEVKYRRGCYGGPTPADQKHPETAKMHDDEKGMTTYPVDPVDILDFAKLASGMKVGIEPLDHRGGGALKE